MSDEPTSGHTSGHVPKKITPTWGLGMVADLDPPPTLGDPLRVFVPGLPRPQGSMRPIVSRSTGKAFVKQSKTMLQWRDHVIATIREAAQEQAWEQIPQDEPVLLVANFYFDRPKSHSQRRARSDRGLKSNGSDLDKLIRAVGDALTYSEVIYDDRQVASIVAKKRYAGHTDDQGVQLLLYRH